MTPIIIHIADSTVMVKIHYIFRDINPYPANMENMMSSE